MTGHEQSPAAGGGRRGVPWRPHARRWPALLIGATAFLFFCNYFLLDETLYAGDTAFVILPFRHYAAERLARGELPLWNPSLFGGTPALAEAQYQLFYLPNLLLFLTGVSRGMGWMLPLHMGLMAAGTYLFARRSLGLGRPAAVFAALAFAFGGFAQARLSVFLQAAAWLPWILLSYDRARRKGGTALLLPGLLLAFQLVTGAPQFAYYTLVLLTALHGYRLLESRGDRLAAIRAWSALGACLLVGGALATAQLLPQLELARLSDRGMHASYEYATEFSLVPRHFVPMMVFPDFWGTQQQPPRDGFFPGEEQGYLGLASLGLIGAALTLLRAPTGSRERRWALFWLLVAVLATLVALGRYNPLYPLLYRVVPGIAMFRAPARWLLITSFAGAMLAGMGLEALLSREASGRRAARAGLLFLAVLLASAVLCLLIFRSPVDVTARVALALVLAAVLALLAFGNPHRREEVRRRAPAALLALLVVDLFLAFQGAEMQETLPVSGLEAAPPTVDLIRGAPGDRFWSGFDPGSLESWQLPGGSELPPAVYRARSASVLMNLMPSCLAAQYGTSGLTGAWGALMPLNRHARPIYTAETPRSLQLRWLRLLNVRYHLAWRPLPDPQLRLQTTDPLYIYEDPAVLPRAFWVPHARPVRGDEAARAVASEDFDPRREVALEGDPNAPSGTGELTPARIVEYRPEYVRLEVTAPTAGTLVLMDTVYPGWHATVDGQPAPIRPANWTGRGIPVDGGTHQVEMRFAPSSVRVGLFLTLAALAALAGCLAAGLRSARR